MNKKDLKGLSQFVADDSFGNYQESTGGGTPLEKGEKLKDHPEAHRVSQPRDDEGKFTYNSVNGKSLKYGPSRGTTIPPFLRGNNAKLIQQGTIFNEMSEDKKKVAQQWMSTIGMTKEELVERCKYYISGKKSFADLGEGSVAKKTTFSPSATYEAGEGNTEAVAKMSSEKAGNLKAITEAAKKYKGGDIPVEWLTKKPEPKPTPKPTPTPKPEPTPVKDEEKTGSGSNEEVLKNMNLSNDDVDFDVEEIKKDPNKFANSVEFKKIWKMVPKDSGIKAGQIIKSIISGKFKNPATLKKFISKKFGSKE